jgi:hypothetical protein
MTRSAGATIHRITTTMRGFRSRNRRTGADGLLLRGW